ncbi:MAG: ZIP family magnesium transporter [Acidobacteria bacterium OLB17]|nr:MAG: ZIP family magnesium transporter [Acidobacteria bacterium OLB17]MCZ2391889.1 ZIP family metal transporter [Acidobacteriota bacterium]
MTSSFWQIFIFGALAALGNILGGLVLFPSKFQTYAKSSVRHILAVGAGFMLAVTFIEILPKTIELWHREGGGSEIGDAAPMILLLAGYLLTQLLEHTIAPHFHLGEEVHADDGISVHSAYAAVAGMGIHTFFDGVMIAAASELSAGLGFLVFLAVVLHKFPEGLTVGSMVLAAGKGRSTVMMATITLGLTTLLGAMLFHIAGEGVSSLVRYALPLAAGVTLYVAASDLVPEINHHSGRSVFVTIAMFLGVGLFFALDLALSSAFH